MARNREHERLAGCECDMTLPRSETCTLSGWVRCNGRLAWLREHDPAWFGKPKDDAATSQKVPSEE